MMYRFVIIIFCLFIASGMNAQYFDCFEATYTDISGSFSKGSVNSCNNDLRCYLVKPTGTFNVIKFNFSQISIDDSEFLVVYEYDLQTGEIFNWPQYNFDSDNPQDYKRNFYLKAQALILIFGNSQGSSSTTDFTFCYETLLDFVQPQYVFNAQKANIDDGSGTENYSNNIVNRYLIQPTNADYVELVFTNYSLAYGESVEIFDGENESAKSLGYYKWDQIPSKKFTSTVNDQSPSGNALYLLFTTDDQENADGWSAEYQGLNYSNTYNLGFEYYSSGNLKKRTITLNTSSVKNARQGIDKRRLIKLPDQKYSDNIGDLEINIYPNPTQGLLKVDIKGYDLTQKTVINIYNLSGKVLKQVSPISESNEIDMSDYSDGIYIMRITIGEKVSEWKIKKE